MKRLIPAFIMFVLIVNGLQAQSQNVTQTLSKKQKSMVAISALTANGNVSALKGGLKHRFGCRTYG